MIIIIQLFIGEDKRAVKHLAYVRCATDTVNEESIKRVFIFLHTQNYQ